MSRANNSAQIAGISMDTYIGYLTTVQDQNRSLYLEINNCKFLEMLELLLFKENQQESLNFI